MLPAVKPGHRRLPHTYDRAADVNYRMLQLLQLGLRGPLWAPALNVANRTGRPSLDYELAAPESERPPHTHAQHAAPATAVGFSAATVCGEARDRQ